MFEKLELYGIIAGVFLIIAGGTAWYMHSLIQQNAVYKQEISQLKQNVADKEKEIGIMNDQAHLKDQVIADNQKKIEDQNGAIHDLEIIVGKIQGADDPAVPFFKQFFEQLNKGQK